MVYYGIALIGMLFIGFFRLDELIFRRKKKNKRPGSGQQRKKPGLRAFSDPDGKPWKKP